MTARGHRVGGDVDTGDGDRPRVGQQQTGDDPQERGLAGAVWPEQRRNATGVDPKVDAGQDVLVAERTCYSLSNQDGARG